MMFCRFCGAALLEDSLFCSKCGKKLGNTPNPRVERVVRILHLRTPIPYAVLVLLLVGIWAVSPHSVPVDYSQLKWTLESNRKLDIPEENLFQQGFSLVLENTGKEPVKEIPVELSARIEPEQPAEIDATFLGNHLPIMEGGKSLPLIVILADQISRPGFLPT